MKGKKRISCEERFLEDVVVCDSGSRKKVSQCSPNWENWRTEGSSHGLSRDRPFTSPKLVTPLLLSFCFGAC